MNYFNTFIRIAPDCPVHQSVVPTPRGKQIPIHVIQYDLISRHPYKFTQEELLFEVHVRRLGLSASERKARHQQLWTEFFSKSRACLRASALPKKYGWGLHFDSEGKVALCAMESKAYQRFADGDDGKLQVVTALRSKRT